MKEAACKLTNSCREYTWQAAVCHIPHLQCQRLRPGLWLYIWNAISLSLSLPPLLSSLFISTLPSVPLLSSYSSDRTRFREHLFGEVCLPPWTEVGVPCLGLSSVTVALLPLLWNPHLKPGSFWD